MIAPIRTKRSGPKSISTRSMNTTMAVPATAPSARPMPPITSIANDSSRVSKENRLGDAPPKWMA